MAEKPALVQLLKVNAGLDDHEALAYKYILITGSLTAGEITEYTGFSYEEVTKALDQLTEKKLIRRLSHVINRYVAVAPYRAFAELLVEFQRAMRELEENAAKSVDSALAEISRTNEEWKASAVKLRDEQVLQAKQDARVLLEEAANARKTLVEKLRSETEVKRSILTDLLKKQVDEHTVRVSEVGRDIALKLDNSVAKVVETASRLKEQAAQSAKSYLSKFDEKLRLFLSMVHDNLAAFQSALLSSIDDIQAQTSTFLEDSTSEVCKLAVSVRTKTDELMREFEESFSQLSTEALKTVSTDVGSAVGTMSSTNKDLELGLTNTVRIQVEKLNETMKNFQTRAIETLNAWKSAAKEKVQNNLSLLTTSIERNLKALTQHVESAKTHVSEILRSHLASTETVSADLASNISTITQSLRTELAAKTSSPTKDLQESCDAAVKECTSLIAALETLSKKSVPLASKVIEEFTSDVNGKLSKMTTSLVADAKSFATDVKQKTLETLSSALTAHQQKGSPAELGKKGDEAPIKVSSLKKDLSKRIDDVVAAFIDGLKNSINALDKYASQKLSATLGFEKELAKKWDSTRETLETVSMMTNEIKLFPQTIGNIANELVDQYNKRAEENLGITSRLLSVHSTTLRDAISGTLKKWNVAVDGTKKEITEILAKHGDEFNQIALEQVESAVTASAAASKTLEELVRQRTESIESDSLITQTEITRQVNSSTEASKRFLEDIEATLKNHIQSKHEELKVAIELRSKDNDKLSAEIANQSSSALARLKDQLALISKSGKEQASLICKNTDLRIKDTASDKSKEIHEIVNAILESFNGNIDVATESYKKEGESIKELIATTLSQHLRNYSESVSKIISEINTTFTKHFEDCNQLTENLGIKLYEMVTTHQDKYERASTKLVEDMVNCIDQDEMAINNTSRRMLKDFTENTTRSAKEAGDVENLMRKTWAEITDTPQINADKTWHCVTKQAILAHIKDMVKRTKSTVTIVVPDIEEGPIKEIKEISRAIRINIIAGIDETSQKKLLKELFTQGNVRLWNLTEKDYISCTRDAEEVLIAPAARKDIDCVATISMEENYVKLYHRFIGPMWMASSREIKERTLG